MKPPITYYGGKATLAQKIVERFPKGYQHMTYAEVFLGGGSVFFEKEPSKLEILNDTNRELMNFYAVVQNDFVSLEREVRISLHSRSLHRDAKAVYENPHLFNPIKRAWAVWVLANQGFSGMLGRSWGYDKAKPTMPRKLQGKRENFTEAFAIRLQNVSLECTDALKIIQSRDTENALFYVDPPYYNSDMGHYDGYTLKDYEELLKTLSTIQGKFVLSSYPSEILEEYTRKYKWNSDSFRFTVAIQNNSDKPKKQKVEVITRNYE